MSDKTDEVREQLEESADEETTDSSDPILTLDTEDSDEDE